MKSFCLKCKLFCLCLVMAFSVANADTYPEVLFENSAMPKSYFHSNVEWMGKSFVHNINGRMPVSDSLFFTPGNSLLLQYISFAGGDWNARILFSHNKAYRANRQDLLLLKIKLHHIADTGLLPSIALLQQDSLSGKLSINRYIKGSEKADWVSVEIPLSDFPGFEEALDIQGISFGQRGQGDQENKLFIDQMEFMARKVPQMKLTGSAMLTKVEAAEYHADLYWQLPLTPSIRYVKIYRSEDNKQFEPVAVRPIFYRKYTDLLPVTNRSYYYKIVWVDYKYNESPASEVIKVDAKRMDDEQLLSTVQKAYIDYFIDQGEVNSGMFKLSPLSSDTRVSVQASGVGILAMIVGVEHGFMGRKALLDRIMKMGRFLLKADNYHGAFPEVLNGRDGKVVASDSCQIAADLKSTAFLMQGLLVARNYFDGDKMEEVALRDMVSTLWKQVNWRAFNGEAHAGLYLYDKWSPVCKWEVANPMGGYNNSFLPYFLSIASPVQAHAMDRESYLYAWKQPLHYNGLASKLGLNKSYKYTFQDTLITDILINQDYWYTKEIFFNGKTYAGVDLAVGDPDSSLLDMQPSFLAFDPRGKKDSTVNYFENQRNLAKIQYRIASSETERFVGLTGVLWGFSNRDSISIRYVPAAALSSYPYLKDESMDAARNYYRRLGRLLWTEYGFRDSFDLQENWVSDNFDPLHQGTVPIMIENGRSGLIWNLFMKDPDVARATKILFTPEE